MKKTVSMLALLSTLLLLPLVVCAEPYGDYQWMSAMTTALGVSPTLLQHEKPASGTGPVAVNGHIIWVTARQEGEQQSTGFLIWDSRQGTIERINNWQHGRIFGLAYHAETKELLIRTAHLLLVVDPRSFEVTKKLPFSKATVWHDMAVVGGELVVLSGNGKDLHLYDTRNFDLLRTISTGLEKIQRLCVFSGNQVVLGSSYWGANLHLADVKTGAVSQRYRVHGSIGYRTFYKLIQLADKRLGLFDPFGSGVMEQFAFSGNGFLTITSGSQMTKNGLGWRIRPRIQSLDGVLTLVPGVDLPATEVVLVLPVRSMYHQELTGESFPQGGQVVVDRLGNRSLRLAMPPLKAGERYSITYYSAKVTRYQAFFHLPGTGATVPIPGEWATYLSDQTVYDLHHPLIGTTLQELAPSGSAPATTVQSVYRFAVGIPYGKGFEPAPTAIVKRSGGCTEHSYIQVALLRKAGIPARYVWSAISDRNGEAPFDHKYAEAWLPELGWVPLEPLTGTREHAGSLINYPLVFGVMDGPGRAFIANGDSLVSFGKPYARFWKSARPSVAWKVGERQKPE